MPEYEVHFTRPARDIDIGHQNMGTVNKNAVRIGTEKGTIRLFFSYDTLVAVAGGGQNAVSVNDWSKTTGKFLNELEPDKSRRVPHAEVLAKAQDRLKQILY
jgi:hypothetical protein